MALVQFSGHGDDRLADLGAAVLLGVGYQFHDGVREGVFGTADWAPC
jgi:hypothetical protein